MQKCLYSKQPQSKSKIVTIQAAGKKLQEIPEISRKTSGDFSAGEFFCRKLQVDAEKPVRVFRKSLPSQPGRITGIMNVLFPLQF